MIARFPNIRALASAYIELIEAGIPRSCITPCFEEAGSDAKEPEEHCLFLEQLYQWHSGHRTGAEADAGEDDMPLSPDFRNRGGVLEVDCGIQYMQALEVALKFDAVLVG